MLSARDIMVRKNRHSSLFKELNVLHITILSVLIEARFSVKSVVYTGMRATRVLTSMYDIFFFLYIDINHHILGSDFMNQGQNCRS